MLFHNNGERCNYDIISRLWLWEVMALSDCISVICGYTVVRISFLSTHMKGRGKKKVKFKKFAHDLFTDNETFKLILYGI